MTMQCIVVTFMMMTIVMIMIDILERGRGGDIADDQNTYSNVWFKIVGHRFWVHIAQDQSLKRLMCGSNVGLRL